MPLSEGVVVGAELTFRKIEVRSSGRWTELDAGLTEQIRWRTETPSGELPSEAVATEDGLEVNFLMGVETNVVVYTFPAGLPAVTVGQVAPDPGGPQPNGLDGVGQPITRVNRARGLPGAAGRTAMVDYKLADNVAYSLSPKVQHQVWVAPGAASRIARALQAEGATITERRTVRELVREFEREGPGLATTLLLAAAAAAAVLAIVRAIFGLYATRRRRTYEFAALTVIGVPARTQKRALLIEQAIVLGVGVLAGVAAGVAASIVALKRVPQFATEPITPPLSFTPDPMVLMGILLATAVAVALVSIVATHAIFRSVSLEQLREAPP